MKLNYLFIPILFIFFSSQLFSQNIPAPPQGPTTSISFDDTEFNFGQAVSGEKVWHTYTFTNTGSKPFIISNAKGSCGCTVPEWPKEPIMPGESGEIFAVFNTKNKKGNQTKMITITGNTNPPQTLLYVKGEVVMDESELSEENKISDFIEFNSADINAEEKSISAYPNPTSKELNLNLKEFTGESVRIQIYNSTRQQMEERKIKAASNDLIQFNVSDYEGGIYSVTVLMEDGKRMSKQFLVVR